MTGCACALSLARGGLRVRIHEAREIASGASGRNGGFALRGAAIPYDQARHLLGRDRARALWALTEQAIDRMEGLAGPALRRTGSLRLAADQEEHELLVRELEALRDDGFAVEWEDRLPAPLRRRFTGAIAHPPDASIHPARWVRRLAAAAAEAGAEVCEGSRVEALDALEAPQVVVATDGYTAGLLAELDAAVRPARGQVLATEALPRLLYPRPHYARHGYDYWQQTPDRRLVIGGFRDASFETEATAEEATTEAIQERIEALAADLVGRPPRVTHRWAGIFGLTDDRLPLAGQVPRHEGLWVACGYSGHGNVLGFACGELVAEAILGRPSPALEWFDPARVL